MARGAGRSLRPNQPEAPCVPDVPARRSSPDPPCAPGENPVAPWPPRRARGALRPGRAAAGSSGTQGASGSSGGQGATGASGAQGASGSSGAQGSSGTQGASGSSGGQGATGASGNQGASGASGNQGASGASGANGAGGLQGQRPPVGRRRQQAAVAAGGVLRDIATTAGAVSLTAVMRFHNPTEGAATLAVRDGDSAAIGFYLDHGRVHEGELAAVTDELYHDWAADTADGHDAIMLAGPRDIVDELNGRARADRLAGLDPDTDPGPETRLSDGHHASAGDLVITRHNDSRYRISATDHVRNGYRWRIATVHPDGALTVIHKDSDRRTTLPPDYVSAHVELGYASTIRTSQGLTTDTSRTLFTGTESRDQVYVPLSRGRRGNHAYIVTGLPGDEHSVLTEEALRPATVVDVFTRMLARDDNQKSATTLDREALDPIRRLRRPPTPTSTPSAPPPKPSPAPRSSPRSTPPPPASSTARAAASTSPALRRGRCCANISPPSPSPVSTPSPRSPPPPAGGNCPPPPTPPPCWTGASTPAVPTTAAADRCRGCATSPRRWPNTPATGPTCRRGAPWSPTSPSTCATSPPNGPPPTRPAGRGPCSAITATTPCSRMWRCGGPPPASTTSTAASPAPTATRSSNAPTRNACSGASPVSSATSTPPPPGGPRRRHRRPPHHPRPVLARPRRTPHPRRPRRRQRAPVAHRRRPVDAPLPADAPAAALWWRLSRHQHLPAIALHPTLAAPGRLRPDWVRDLDTVFGTTVAARITSDPAWPALVAAVESSDPQQWPPHALLDTAAHLLYDGQHHAPLRPADLATALTVRVALITTPHPRHRPDPRRTRRPRNRIRHAAAAGAPDPHATHRHRHRTGVPEGLGGDEHHPSLFDPPPPPPHDTAGVVEPVADAGTSRTPPTSTTPCRCSTSNPPTTPTRPSHPTSTPPPPVRARRSIRAGRAAPAPGAQRRGAPRPRQSRRRRPGAGVVAAPRRRDLPRPVPRRRCRPAAGRLLHRPSHTRPAARHPRRGRTPPPRHRRPDRRDAPPLRHPTPLRDRRRRHPRRLARRRHPRRAGRGCCRHRRSRRRHCPRRPRRHHHRDLDSYYQRIRAGEVLEPADLAHYLQLLDLTHAARAADLDATHARLLATDARTHAERCRDLAHRAQRDLDRVAADTGGLVTELDILELRAVADDLDRDTIHAAAAHLDAVREAWADATRAATRHTAAEAAESVAGTAVAATAVTVLDEHRTRHQRAAAECLRLRLGPHPTSRDARRCRPGTRTLQPSRPHAEATMPVSTSPPSPTKMRADPLRMLRRADLDAHVAALRAALTRAADPGMTAWVDDHNVATATDRLDRTLAEHTRLAAQADAIGHAQDAITAAQAADHEYRTAADQLAALRTQLAGTSALRPGARRRLIDDIGALEPSAARLRDAAHAAADLAAERTRAAEQHVPRSVWTTTVHRAADTDRLAAELDTARTPSPTRKPPPPPRLSNAAPPTSNYATTSTPPPPNWTAAATSPPPNGTPKNRSAEPNPTQNRQPLPGSTTSTTSSTRIRAATPPPNASCEPPMLDARQEPTGSTNPGRSGAGHCRPFAETRSPDLEIETVKIVETLRT